MTLRSPSSSIDIRSHLIIENYRKQVSLLIMCNDYRVSTYEVVAAIKPSRTDWTPSSCEAITSNDPFRSPSCKSSSWEATASWSIQPPTASMHLFGYFWASPLNSDYDYYWRLRASMVWYCLWLLLKAGIRNSLKSTDIDITRIVMITTEFVRKSHNRCEERFYWGWLGTIVGSSVLLAKWSFL